ncbi:NADP-dependent oxidoreductase [Synechococcus sp. BIOS-U3-1]|uniref:aldo/keto reductase n=1 Tax=Synechococcus sp. BIOS-U3-1 TaxID=1400865 RepID=UPI001861EBA9|nr:aldo/keto reductase [Synechococcus sp. BIOS-U3-1]QNI59718.1 NADP-dependent oxidoreductase [Synechococcus sp. BIOS-U3-1]|tara:strand:+ start:1899 stop:3107 length:1209 start_codon:yes stop_codon:yes gene_type:complete
MGSSRLPTRRFGRTEISMPVLSLGGMRFQQSWSDLEADAITAQSQRLLQSTLERAVQTGFHHVETARHYGSSERQLGWALPDCPDSSRILQTKVPPQSDSALFEADLEVSFSRLDVDRVDLLSIHGINLHTHLDQTVRPGGCLDVVRRWQAEGRIGHVGFSTHGDTALIVDAIETGVFDYVNLHWYFIRQENEPAIAAASLQDMGVFIISPTDKGGHLHTPGPRLLELTDPLHPIVFNDLFCLRDPRVHTLSVGAARPQDLDLHLQAVSLLDQAAELVAPIESRLRLAECDALGSSWLTSWRQGLPEWQDTPGEINLPMLLWLHNLLEAWDLEGFVKARYGLLGRAGHWFPGANADALDASVSEELLLSVLNDSPWKERIPSLLRSLRERAGGSPQERLSSS